MVPGHLIFFYLICLVEGQSVTNSKIFILLYLVAGVVQVRMTVCRDTQPSGPLSQHQWCCGRYRVQVPSYEDSANMLKASGMA